MANWRAEIDIRQAWGDGDDVSVARMRQIVDAVINELEKLPAGFTSNHPDEDTVEAWLESWHAFGWDLHHPDSAEEAEFLLETFNLMWQCFYDWADAIRLWVNIY